MSSSRTAAEHREIASSGARARSSARQPPARLLAANGDDERPEMRRRAGAHAVLAPRRFPQLDGQVEEALGGRLRAPVLVGVVGGEHVASRSNGTGMSSDSLLPRAP